MSDGTFDGFLRGVYGSLLVAEDAVGVRVDEMEIEKSMPEMEKCGSIFGIRFFVHPSIGVEISDGEMDFPEDYPSLEQIERELCYAE